MAEKIVQKPIYIIYSRKSKFTGKGESVQNQIEKCQHYIYANFDIESDEQIITFQDEGYSGGNTDRPEFQKMLQLCYSKTLNIKAIVCYKLDRFSRSASDFSIAYHELDNLDIRFASVTDHFDSETSMGKAMMQISSVFAELERNILTERIRDNKEGLAKTGRWLGGTTPTGYKSTRITYQHDENDRKRTMCYLETIPSEKEIVQKIFHDYLESHSLTKVQTTLRLADIKTKNDTYYSSTAIRAILTNPVYMSADEDAWNYFESHDTPIYQDKIEFNGQYGIMAYNKTFQQTHNCNKLKDMKDWIIAIGKHEPFVSGKDWVTVQKVLEQNANKTFRSAKSSLGLLSGLLICGNCKSYMRPKAYRQKTEDGLQKFGYLCETKDKSRLTDCQMKNPPGNELDRMVCDEIKKLNEDEEFFTRSLEKLLESNHVPAASMQSNLDLLVQQEKELDAKIQKLIESLSSINGAAVEYVNKQINEYHEQKEELHSEILYQRTLIAETLSPEDEINLIRERLSDFASRFDSLTFDEKRATLKMLIKKVVWDGTNVHLYLIGDDSDDNPPPTPEEPQRQDCQRASDAPQK